MMNMIGRYMNGNYVTTIFADGTKIRETEHDEFIPEFAENCDVKITDRCDGACPFCYEGCTRDGAHGDILNYKFLDTLHPYTEMALNGNDLSHPDLIPFLKKLKSKKVIANMTVNQMHFERHQEFIRHLVDNKLIYGLGVSLREPTPEFVAAIKQYPNAVVHTINGILNPADIDIMKGNDIKLLILGYKHLRRGVDWYDADRANIERNQAWLKESLPDIVQMFKVVSFDNLAIEQLDVRRLMSPEQWESFYMGDDGAYTFYLDLVEGVYAKNSVSLKRQKITDSIDDMFRSLQPEEHKTISQLNSFVNKLKSLPEEQAKELAMQGLIKSGIATEDGKIKENIVNWD